MPVYEYRCTRCGNMFEEDLKVEDRDVPLSFPCDKCADYTIKRSVGCGGFRLKGFCWARDNYARTIGDDPRGNFQKDEEL